MMHPVVFFDFLSFLASTAALIFVLKGWRRAPKRDARVLLTGLLAFIMFYTLCLVLEWSGATNALETTEDFIGALVPMWWAFVFYAFLQEITNRDRRESEACLRESEQRYRDLVENINDVIYATDDKGVITYISPTVKSVLGYGSSEIIGQSYTEFVHDEDLPRIMEQFQRVISGHVEPSEYRLLTKSGEVRWVLTSSRRVSVGGRVTGLRGVLTDISKRKKVEEALRQSEAFNKGIIKSSYDCIKVLDLEGRLQFMSRGGQDLLEIHDITPYLNESWVDFWKGAYQVAALDAISKAKKGCLGSFQGFCPTVSGRPRWWDVIITPIEGTDGNVERLLSISRDITDGKRAEQALRESEERFQQVAENAEEWIWEVDVQGLYTYSSPIVEKVLGYEPEEVVGKKHFYDLFHPEEREQIKKAALEVFARKEPFREFVNPNAHKNGDIVWLSTSGVPILDKEGNLIGYRGADTNITGRKHAEEELTKSEEKYRTLFESAADAIVLVDTQGNLLDVNHRSEQETGYSRGEILGTNVFTSGIMTKSSSAEALLHFTRLLRGQEQTMFEIIGATKAGDVIPYEITAVPLKKDGLPVAVQAILRNISERKQAEETLRMEKEKFEILVEESPLAVSLIGEDGQYKYVNPKFFEMFGYTLEDVSHGRAWFDKAYPDREYREEVISAWIGDIENSHVGQARARTFTVRCKDGSEKFIHFRPVTMENGDQLVIYEDITQTRRLERQLRQAQKMEAIGTLAGGIAHDFNNILTPILVRTEMALMEIPAHSSVRLNLEEALEAGQRAKELVKQILTFTRQLDQEPISMNLSPIVKESLKLLRASLPSTIEIRKNIKADSGLVVADPTQMQQVVMNLCTNAAQAMNKMGSVLEVALSDAELDEETAKSYPGLSPGSYVRLRVSDTGSGIEPGIKDRIFDPYFTTKAPGEGTGIGLAVVHGIVKSHSGLITVDSEPGKGTTFTVLLPTIGCKVAVESKIFDSLPTGNERILFVDDEKPIAKVTQQMLEGLGYEVESRTSSIEALAAFREHPDEFDLVITDMTMPNMTGKTLAQELIEIRPDVPVILCTGFSHVMNEEEALRIGIRAFVMKPLVMRDLAETIRKVLDNN